MRDNWQGNLELHRRLLSQPLGVRLIPEFLRVIASDVLDLQSEWFSRSDTPAGFTFLRDGGLKLQSSPSTRAIFETGGDSVVEDPARGPDLHVLELRWSGADAPNYEIDRVRARMRPRRDGGEPQEVEEWRCQVFRLARVVRPGQRDAVFELEPMTGVLRTPAVGPDDETVTFDVRSRLSPHPVLVGTPPVIEGDEAASMGPRTYIHVWGVKGEGEPAGNTAWVGDDETLNTAADDWRARGRFLAPVSDETEGSLGSRYREQPTAFGVPRFELESGGYVETTISFTGSGDRIDLGASPSEELEVVARGQRLAGSALTFELSVPGADTWFEVADGDVIGQDNTPTGGQDLSGLAVRQDYDARVTLTPSSAGDVSPIARRFGIQERTAVLFDGDSQVEGGEWGFRSLSEPRGELTELVLRLFHTGVRDYRDPVTELLSDSFAGELEMRLWVGHPSLARQNWLEIDSFLIDDWKASQAGVRVVCLSVLTEARRLIPEWNPSTETREAFDYTNASLAEVYLDVLEGHVGLPARRIGPVVEDDETVVTRRIEEMDAKEALDGVAFLAGGGVISSQGRAKFVRLFDHANDEGEPEGAPVHTFVRGMSHVGETGPGLADRVDEAFVPWLWSEQDRRFRRESRAVHGLSLARLGRARVNPPLRLSDTFARWIRTEALANRVSVRTVETLGLGQRLISVRSLEPVPWLEPGDIVNVELDQLIERDPNTGRAIRGPILARGVIARQADPFGYGWEVWIRSLADVIPSSQSGERVPLLGARSVSVIGQRWRNFDSGPTPLLAPMQPVLRIAIGEDVRSLRVQFSYRIREGEPPENDPDFAADDTYNVGSGILHPDNLVGDGVYEFRLEENSGSVLFGVGGKLGPITSTPFPQPDGEGTPGPEEVFQPTFWHREEDVTTPPSGIELENGSGSLFGSKLRLGANLSMSRVMDAGSPTTVLELSASTGEGNDHDLGDHLDTDFFGLANGHFIRRVDGEWTNVALVFSMVGGTATEGQVPDLPASKITSGRFPFAHLPTLTAGQVYGRPSGSGDAQAAAITAFGLRADQVGGSTLAQRTFPSSNPYVFTQLRRFAISQAGVTNTAGVAGIIVSEDEPSGDAPDGTLWVRTGAGGGGGVGPHELGGEEHTDVDFFGLANGHFIRRVGGEWTNVSLDFSMVGGTATKVQQHAQTMYLNDAQVISANKTFRNSELLLDHGNWDNALRVWRRAATDDVHLRWETGSQNVLDIRPTGDVRFYEDVIADGDVEVGGRLDVVGRIVSDQDLLVRRAATSTTVLIDALTTGVFDEAGGTLAVRMGRNSFDRHIEFGYTSHSTFGQVPGFFVRVENEATPTLVTRSGRLLLGTTAIGSHTGAGGFVTTGASRSGGRLTAASTVFLDHFRLDRSGDLGDITMTNPVRGDNQGVGLSLEANGGLGNETRLVWALSADGSRGLLIPWDNTAQPDIGMSTRTWRDLHLSRDAHVGGDVFVDGDVGIGFPTPGRRLHVHTDLAVERTASTTSALVLLAESNLTSIFSRATQSSTTARAFRIMLGNTERMRITTGGQLLLGTTTVGDVGAGGIRAVGRSRFDARVDLEGDAFVDSRRVAKVIVSTEDPSGSAPEGTLWCKVAA